ncbi:hypothetical protein FSP39_000835 [Pinctada imbricata]|uniref:TROVE domain-containing protein n=1 Tax=Pinctada imbricata TaxID=66713 RepID=A0AA88YGU1_PINIB|nr:hypothetical protein FSP39_000835 [Pinctada imbricata]
MDEMEVDDDLDYSIQECCLPIQRESLPYQKQNSNGGYSYECDNITKLHRFLCLGSEEGTYYTGEQDCKKDNAKCIDSLISKGEGERVVDAIETISVTGRASKQFPILFALALCCRSNDQKVKDKAYMVMPKVCRIPTHLFQFIKYCQNVSDTGSGWGRAHRRAISNWYIKYMGENTENEAEGLLRLAHHITKYKSRHGWSHKDVLRLAHVKSSNTTMQFLLRCIAKGLKDAEEFYKDAITAVDYHRTSLSKVVEFLEVVERLSQIRNPDEMTRLIIEHKLAREHVPTQMLKDATVWRALIRYMPIRAMLRNLGKMTSMNVLPPYSFEHSLTLDKIRDKVSMKNARIHPFDLLIALRQYEKGRGELGKLVWTPDDEIKRALENALYDSFVFTEPTNKKHLLAIDVSESMDTPVVGTPSITARDGAAVMAMHTLRNETNANCKIVAFSCAQSQEHPATLRQLQVNHTDKLNTVIETCKGIPSGDTDCALPILHALEKKEKYDVFIVYTDSETYFGNTHPADALKQYSYSLKTQTKFIVCGMTSNGFTLANPEDPFMMDVVGFDSNAPMAIMNFINGNI